MNKKAKLTILIVIASIILISLIFFTIDFSRVYNNNSPIFCIKAKVYDDNVSTEYFGLGYKVIKYVETEDDLVAYKIGTIFMKYNNPFLIKFDPVGLSPNVKNITFATSSIQTHLYIENFDGPKVDVLKSKGDVTKYLEKFNDSKLALDLNSYPEEYFNDKLLVLVTLQESSGSNTNIVDRVSKLVDSGTIDIFVKRNVAQIGTTDMAMWHLIIELDKSDVSDTDKFQVLDSSVKYL